MESTTAGPETTATAAAAASSSTFNLDALGLGPPAKRRQRGQASKATRYLVIAVLGLLVFNLGVRMGHRTKAKAAPPAAGAPGAGPGAGGAAPPGAPGAAAKPAVTGTVKVIDGNAIYVGQPDGSTRKVVAGESTHFSRTVPAAQRDIQPGDTVTVEGAASPDGSVNATRIDGKASALNQP